MPPVLCDYCESLTHDACNCPYRGYIDATCASFEKKFNELIDKMVETTKERIAEYSRSFTQSREDTNLQEPDSNLGLLKPEVSLYNDFEPFYQSRSNL